MGRWVNHRRVLLTALLTTGMLALLAGEVMADDLTAMSETYGTDFRRVEVGDLIVFYQQRTVDEAIVEGDYIVHQFDRTTGEFLQERIHWREDVPEQVVPLITREEAESMVYGDIEFTKLYIISPESHVFPLIPVPQNPCWVVRSVYAGRPSITVIDAIQATILGYGVPPPHTAFSLSGPQYFQPCQYSWDDWYENAEYWFNTMGYSTEAIQWPTEEQVRSHVESCSTAMFYELAHGGSYSFASGCVGGVNGEYTYAFEIANWIADYSTVPFTFIGSCDGMCDTASGSFSYEFRKGSTENAVTVGYCHMSLPECDEAWTYSLAWQEALFGYMSLGYTVKAAFDQATADYPMCVRCMQFAGDHDFAAVPVVKRNYEPVLSNGRVTPETLYVDTTCTYSVIYSDPEGDAPVFAYVYVDGDPHAMEPEDDSTYSYTTHLPAGSHDYYFYFDDGCGVRRLPESGIFLGPEVYFRQFIRADANADMLETVADAVYVISYIYRQGPCVCEDACDVNDDGRVTSADAIYLVAFIYRAGPPPPYPFTECGQDTSEDQLRCETHPCVAWGQTLK